MSRLLAVFCMLRMGKSKRNWMQGFPPKKEAVIQFSDGSFYSWPQLKWSVNNIQQLVPTKTVWRGVGAVRPPIERNVALEELSINSENDEQLPWHEVLRATETDALAIMHAGDLVYESYHDYASPRQSHLIMSCAKSIVGLLLEIMIANAELDDAILVTEILPELRESAWADATLRDVLDMQVGMDFDENYLNPDSDVWRYLRCGGMLPQAQGQSECLTDYLPTVKKQGKHGQVFAYREPNINVASWILRRVSNQHLNDLLSEQIWQHLGVESDGLYMVDLSGAETTMTLTLRSFLQFGEWIRTGGDGRLNPSISDKLFSGGDVAKFAKAKIPSMQGWSYKSMWWVRHMPHGNAICARGAHGQLLYIDAEKQLVVGWYSSTEQAPGHLHDHWRMPLIDAVTSALNNI